MGADVCEFRGDWVECGGELYFDICDEGGASGVGDFDGGIGDGEFFVALLFHAKGVAGVGNERVYLVGGKVFSCGVGVGDGGVCWRAIFGGGRDVDCY